MLFVAAIQMISKARKVSSPLVPEEVFFCAEGLSGKNKWRPGDELPCKGLQNANSETCLNLLN